MMRPIIEHLALETPDSPAKRIGWARRWQVEAEPLRRDAQRVLNMIAISVAADRPRCRECGKPSPGGKDYCSQACFNEANLDSKW